LEKALEKQPLEKQPLEESTFIFVWQNNQFKEMPMLFNHRTKT